MNEIDPLSPRVAAIRRKATLEEEMETVLDQIDELQRRKAELLRELGLKVYRRAKPLAPDPGEK